MYDIVVNGGGLVGLAFALDLAIKRQDLSIAIIDSKFADSLSFNHNVINNEFRLEKTIDDRIYALSPSNISQLELIGINSNQLRHGVVDTMQIYHKDLSNSFTIKTKKILNSHLAFIIEEKLYRHALLAKIVQLSNIKIINSKLHRIQREVYGFGCYFEHMDKISAKLLIGADGVNSLVRKSINIGWTEKKYRHSAIVANFKCSIHHQNTARQWFLTNGDILACLPLFDNHISIVLSSSNPPKYDLYGNAEYVLQQDSDNTLLEDFVVSVTQNIFGELQLINNPKVFPLRMGIANIGFDKNVALIGDAFHTIHPLAGQGVNLGLSDAWDLSAIIAEVSKTKIGDRALLQRYYFKRIKHVRQMQLVCDTLYKCSLLASSSTYFEKFWDNGFKLLDNASWLTDFMVKFAV